MKINPIDEYVGSRLRQIRKSKKVSLTHMAIHLGISCNQLNKYENAVNRISASKLFEASKILGCPVQDFFTCIPSKPEQPDVDYILEHMEAMIHYLRSKRD